MNNRLRTLKMAKRPIFVISLLLTLLLFLCFGIVVSLSESLVFVADALVYDGGDYSQRYLNNDGDMLSTLISRDEKTYTPSPYPNISDPNRITFTLRLNAFYELEIFVFGEKDLPVIRMADEEQMRLHEPNRVFEINTNNPFYWRINFYPLATYESGTQTYGQISQSIESGSVTFTKNGKQVDITYVSTNENGFPLSDLRYLDGLFAKDYAEVRNTAVTDNMFSDAAVYEILIDFSSIWKTSSDTGFSGVLDAQPPQKTTFRIKKGEQPIKNILLPEQESIIGTPKLFYSIALGGLGIEETFLNTKGLFAINKEKEKNNISINLHQKNFDTEITNNVRGQLMLINPAKAKATLSYRSTGGSYLQIYSIDNYIKLQPGTMILNDNGNCYLSPATTTVAEVLFSEIDYNNFGLYRIVCEYQLQYVNPDTKQPLGEVFSCADTYAFQFNNDGWYGIEYELNGGSFNSGYIKPEWYDSRQDRITPLPNQNDLSRTKAANNEWQFIGWYYDAKFRSEQVLYIDFDRKQDIKLYAKWTPLYTVTLNHQGGISSTNSVKAPLSLQLPPNAVNSMRPMTPARTGYTFGGYFDKENGTTNAAPIGNQYYDFVMNPVRVWDKESNTTLYAKWTANEYLVTLDANGGSKGTESVRATFDSNMPIATPPEREFYIFKGYYDAKEDGTQYYTANMSSSRTWNKDKNTTLFARWEGISLAINYKDVGDVVFSGKQGNSYPTNHIYSLNTKLVDPNKDGYDFAGWYIDRDGNGNLLDTLGAFDYTSDVTLYAKWVRRTATLYGTGTQSDPYKIFDVYQLRDLSDQVNDGNNFSGKYFILQNNIVGIGAWTPIGNNNHEVYYSPNVSATSRRFAGVFDGGGFTLGGYTISRDSQTYADTYSGLFGYVASGGVVKNLKVSNVSVDGSSTRSNGTKGGVHNGAIAGINSGTISSCEVLGGSINGLATLDTHIGGIAGYMFVSGAKIIDCKNAASINGSAGRATSHGGIVGSVNNGIIYNCSNSASITGTTSGTASYPGAGTNYRFHGGIAGVACALVISCTNTSKNITSGNVPYYGGGAGEIVGYLHNGSDSYTNTATGDSGLKIDTLSGYGYYSAVLNSTSQGILATIGFLENVSHSARLPVALQSNYSYTGIKGSTPTRIAANYFDSYLNDVTVVSAIFETGFIVVPLSFISSGLPTFDDTQNSIENTNSYLDMDMISIIVLASSLVVGCAGFVLLGYYFYKRRKGTNDGKK